MTKTNKKYSPPRNGKTFALMWNRLIDEITSRDNFKPGHLYQLEILCDLYQEYDRLRDIIEEFGYTYENDGGRNGAQIKVTPEVGQFNRIRSEIREYSKLLGLTLYKDKETTKGNEAKDEWS